MHVKISDTYHQAIDHNGFDLSYLDDFQGALFPKPIQIKAYTRQLIATLSEIRRAAVAYGEWEKVAARIRQHPIRDFLHQDPLTWRAFHKPRGYAGDAVMLDYIYQEMTPDNMSPLGRILFEHFVTEYDCTRAVRYRRNRIAQIIDSESGHKPDLRILAVGCGHLREADLSYKVRTGKIARYVALDQDAESLEEVQQRITLPGLEICHAPIIDLVSRKVFGANAAQFDLIYALGLYDYLPQKLGQRLTRRLFDLLAPEGLLVIANVLPDIHEEAYLQTFMDWHLISRDLDVLHDLAAALPVDQVNSQCIELDPYRVFAFLKVGKT